jgi:hypothetical protein
VVEHLPSKCETLLQFLVSPKRKKEREKDREREREDRESERKKEGRKDGRKEGKKKKFNYNTLTLFLANIFLNHLVYIFIIFVLALLSFFHNFMHDN